jgi:hypothetical protein
MEKIEELIAALEKCKGPSLQLDGMIWCAANDLEFVMWDGAGCVYRDPSAPKWDGGIKHAQASIVRPYTASIDAAVTLVNRILPDWRIENLCEWDAEILRDQGPWMCDLVQRRHEFFDRQSAKCSHAPTAALALLIATLRAKLAQEKTNA